MVKKWSTFSSKNGQKNQKLVKKNGQRVAKSWPKWPKAGQKVAKWPKSWPRMVKNVTKSWQKLAGPLITSKVCGRFRAFCVVRVMHKVRQNSRPGFFFFKNPQFFVFKPPCYLRVIHVTMFICANEYVHIYKFVGQTA